MITPEWSPQSSWQLTSILSQPKRPSMGFLDFLALRLHHWAQTCRVLRRNGWRSQPSKMGTINFHYWRSQKKKMATYRQFWETSAGVFFRLCDTFPLPQIVPSARNEAPENKTSHSDSDIVKSMSKNTPTSTLWPGKHLIFCAFASLQGLEIFLKHCRSNLMLHCQIPSDAWLFQAKTVQPIS